MRITCCSTLTPNDAGRFAGSEQGPFAIGVELGFGSGSRVLALGAALASGAALALPTVSTSTAGCAVPCEGISTAPSSGAEQAASQRMPER